MRGDSGSGSASTVSQEDTHLVLSSSEDSSTPDECELGLGLSLGVGGGRGGCLNLKLKAYRAIPKILTAEDFNSVVSASSPSSSSSSSSSSSTFNRANGIAGTKRAADSVPAPNAAASQVVGWPPIRTYRMNNLVNHGKSPLNKEFDSTSEKRNGEGTALEKSNDGRNQKDSNSRQRLWIKSLFVKVNMDGVPIGRKVDLNAHNCYETLAQTLENMFSAALENANAARSNLGENPSLLQTTEASKLLDGSSGYVLTYEDKDGDWMLVGDMPWRMFVNTVKRLRIMRSSEANGISL